MIRRLLSFFVIVWLLGFLWFAVFLPQPSAEPQTDAVIVPTGGPGRIAHGLDVVRSDRAQFLLVTGVDREVTPTEFAEEFNASMELMECCVALGYDAVDTRSNAQETARWVRDNRIRSLRLVTTDWHMRRASAELRREVPTNIRIVEDAVRSEPSLFTLFLEYHKLLASWISRLWGDR